MPLTNDWRMRLLKVDGIDVSVATLARQLDIGCKAALERFERRAALLTPEEPQVTMAMLLEDYRKRPTPARIASHTLQADKAGTRARIAELKAAGKNQYQVAGEIGVSRQRVNQLWNKV